MSMSTSVSMSVCVCVRGEVGEVREEARRGTGRERSRRTCLNRGGCRRGLWNRICCTVRHDPSRTTRVWIVDWNSSCLCSWCCEEKVDGAAAAADADGSDDDDADVDDSDGESVTVCGAVFVFTPVELVEEVNESVSVSGEGGR